MDYSTAHQLAREIRASEEYQTYHRLRELVTADETTDALLKEYRKLQMRIQMAAMSGTQADAEDLQRFQGITALLFTKPEVQQFLLSEMRMQQLLADVLKIVSEAADIDMGIPDIAVP